MLLDLTVRPIQISPEECPRSLVIRTLRTGTYVTGIITQLFEGSYRKPVDIRLVPAAEIKKGEHTYFETRLPLQVPLEDHMGSRGLARGSEFTGFLPNPFKVSSAYRSIATKKLHTADIDFIIEHRGTLKGKRCLVSVQEAGNILFTVTIKDFESPPLLHATEEPVPLQRLQALSQRGMTAWERLTDDDNDGEE